MTTGEGEDGGMHSRRSKRGGAERGHPWPGSHGVSDGGDRREAVRSKNMTGFNARPEGALGAEMGTWARQVLKSREYRTSLRRRLLRGDAGRLEEMIWHLALEQSVVDARNANDDLQQYLDQLTDEELETIVKIGKDARKLMENVRARMNADRTQTQDGDSPGGQGGNGHGRTH